MKLKIIRFSLVLVSCSAYVFVPRPVDPNSASLIYSFTSGALFSPSAANLQPDQSQYNAQDNIGQYSYGYAITDGTHRSESRTPEGQVTGTYGYMGPDRQRVEMSYTAGKEGFKPSSSSLPQNVETTQEVQDATRQHELAVLRVKDLLAQTHERLPPTKEDSHQPVTVITESE